MMKYVRLLAIAILIYGAYFYFMPLVNIIISLRHNFTFVKDVIFWTDLIQLIIFFICGLGLLRCLRFARLIWLIYSIGMLFMNIPTFQILAQGDFLKFSDLPFMYWLKIYSLFVLLFFSIIFLNLPVIKVLFKKA